MTKFEFPEISPRIFNPAPMVELEVGPEGATDAAEGAVGAAAAGAVVAGEAASEDGVDGVEDASVVFVDEIAG
jgi:hypothetical protein